MEKHFDIGKAATSKPFDRRPRFRFVYDGSGNSPSEGPPDPQIKLKHTAHTAAALSGAAAFPCRFSMRLALPDRSPRFAAWPANYKPIPCGGRCGQNRGRVLPGYKQDFSKILLRQVMLSRRGGLIGRRRQGSDGKGDGGKTSTEGTEKTHR